MTDIKALEDRIDRLESRNAISELISAYAVACDEHDMPRLTNLFTERGVFGSVSGAMVAEGRAAIESMFIELFKIRGPAFHWTHDLQIAIDPDDPDRATGMVLSHAETSPDNTVSLAAMRYHDEYTRDDGVWRFDKRVISFLYYVPVTEFADVFKDRNRLSIGGERLPADYPENLGPWRAFHAEYVAPGDE